MDTYLFMETDLAFNLYFHHIELNLQDKKVLYSKELYILV
jgi:hypothetical protein